MANRFARDVAINRALDILDSPRLNELCRGGTKTSPAVPVPTVTDPSFATQWAQDCVDLAHNLFPMQGLIKNTGASALVLSQGVEAYTIPSDYAALYENGIVVDSYDSNGAVNGILVRLQGPRGLSRLLSYQTGASAQARPQEFGIYNGQLHVRPVPNLGNSPSGTYTATWWYYSLPGTMAGTTVPVFPNDYWFIQYLVNRGLEFLREVPADTADKVLTAGLTRAKSAGLQAEAESDQIPVDRQAFPGSQNFWEDPSNWMGRPALNP